MITFSIPDILVIIVFFLLVLSAGFYASSIVRQGRDEYFLSGRNVGLLLFVMTNVSTWYGGILGMGEFTYSYGILSWFTQGLPYYIFAVLFAFFLAEKIRNANLVTIPDKIEQIYGKKAALAGSVLVFLLVSPAPYLLMLATMITMIFGLNILLSLVIATLLSIIYLFKGGLKSDIYTDVVEFIFMFAGFAVCFLLAYFSLGDFTYLKNNLPSTHLKLTGNQSEVYIIVWFLIALWTFTDPGFHQRCNAARDGKTARNGILISIFFWALFDFLTTATGLYARAALPLLDSPVMAYPMLAEKLLGPGLKGLFYAAMLATILSTSNSFLFISGTTFSNDIINRLGKGRQIPLRMLTAIGMLASGLVSILLAWYYPSVVQLWYLIGSICIPGLILPVITSYYSKLSVSPGVILYEMALSSLSGVAWWILRDMRLLPGGLMYEVEPMIIGLLMGVLIHTYGFLRK